MEKQITITLTERQARTLADGLHNLMHQLDELYKENNQPRTKQSADVLEEIFEDIRGQLFTE